MKPHTRLFLRKLFATIAPTTAQAGQDSWVINQVHNRRKNGFFVEIGAHDGVELSNTYLLEKRYQWDGICIEANPKSYKSLQENRRAKCLNICIGEDEGEVLFHLDGMMGGIIEHPDDVTESNLVRLKTHPLESVLDTHNAPNTIDYLSIDVEGAEEKILSAFNFDRYTFLSMTIERPTPAIETLLKNKQYLKVMEIPGLDSFYIHQSHADTYLSNIMAIGRAKRLLLRR